MSLSHRIIAMLLAIVQLQTVQANGNYESTSLWERNKLIVVLSLAAVSCPIGILLKWYILKEEGEIEAENRAKARADVTIDPEAQVAYPVVELQSPAVQTAYPTLELQRPNTAATAMSPTVMYAVPERKEAKSNRREGRTYE